ncbi:MAG: TonB-dependent receptor [Rhodospirillaceae bacterium]|nr:TonB-dependent receptor [Rhodospirillaceae bacterium]
MSKKDCASVTPCATTKHRNILLSSGSAFAIFSAMAFAPQPVQAADTAALVGLEEVVVSARRVDENLQRTPLSVTALGADALKSMNITRIQELGAVTPNLVIRDAASNGMGTIAYLRGIGSISVQVLGDPPINIYVDGVVRPRPTGNAFDLPDVERIEVLRGPQGTLFGRNTTGGAIALYTKAPTEEFGGSLSASYGKNNEVSTEVVVNTGALGDTGIRSKLTFQHHTRDGWINTPGRGKSNSAGYQRTTSGAFTLAADPTDQLSITNTTYFDKINSLTAYQLVFANATALSAFSTSPGLGGPPVIIGTTPLDIYYSDPRRLNDPYATSWGNTLNIAYEASENLTIKSITGFSGMIQKQTGQLGGSMLFGTVNRGGGVTRTEPINTMTSNNSNRQTQFSEELQASGTFGEFSYTAGLYYFMEDIYENLTTNTPAVGAVYTLTELNRNYTPKTNSYAGYANLSYKPTALDEKLEITGGIRYTDEKKSITRNSLTTSSSAGVTNNTPNQSLSKSWNNVGWTGSVSYQWTPDIMTYVRGSSAFRAGSYTAVPGTPPVDPEKATGVEAGFKSEAFDNRLRLNGAFFKTWYDNLQISQRNAATSVSVTVNAGKATFTGFDLEGTGILGNGFQINGSLGYVKPKYKEYFFLSSTGVPTNIAQYGRFPLVARWTWNLGGQYTADPMDIGVLSARVDYSQQSSYVFQPVGVIPAGVVQPTALTLSPNNDTQKSGKAKNLRVNLALSEIPVGTDTLQNVQVQLYGDNLTNHRYRLSGVDFGTYATASFNRPRSYGIRLSADF